VPKRFIRLGPWPWRVWESMSEAFWNLSKNKTECVTYLDEQREMIITVFSSRLWPLLNWAVILEAAGAVA